MNTLQFCGSDMTPEMQALVGKAKAEFTNVKITVEDCKETHALGDLKYAAIANGTMVTGDTTHVLFERIKNIIGEAHVAVNQTANEREPVINKVKY